MRPEREKEWHIQETRKQLGMLGLGAVKLMLMGSHQGCDH